MTLPIMPMPVHPGGPSADIPDTPHTTTDHGVTPGDMLPPAHLIMFAPPPPPTYTIKQLLDYPLQTPSPPSGVSIALLEAQTNRPTHSSARAMDFETIEETTLRPILGIEIANFREQIQSMESIRFSHSMAIPWEASPMMSEGCVTGYLDAQVLGAAWQAVLQMLPKERDYDLQMVKQVPAKVCPPFHTVHGTRRNILTSRHLYRKEYLIKPTLSYAGTRLRP